MRTDYYSVLQVERTASDGEIRKAFRRLILTHHPDRNGNNPQSAESTILLYEAYATLSDSTKRAEYDKQLETPVSRRTTMTMRTLDPAAPEAIRCARCSRCDDTLRHSEFYMVVGLISFSKQSVEQPGVYCSGCRTALGAKWLALSMLCGWWSITGLFNTPKAMVRNIAGGLRRGHSQRALLRLLASRLIWQKQFSDAYRVVRRLSYLDPEYPKLSELTAKVKEGRRKPQKRSSFALHPRRLPTPLYALPIALFPVISTYVSVIVAGDIQDKQQIGFLASPIAKFFGSSAPPSFTQRDSGDPAQDATNSGLPNAPSAAANYNGTLAGSFSGKAGSGSVFPDNGQNGWSAVNTGTRPQNQRLPDIDDQRATQAYFQPADVPDLPEPIPAQRKVAQHKIVYALHKPLHSAKSSAGLKVAIKVKPAYTTKPARVAGAPRPPATLAKNNAATSPPSDPADTVAVDPPGSYDDGDSVINSRTPSASTQPVTTQPDAHVHITH